MERSITHVSMFQGTDSDDHQPAFCPGTNPKSTSHHTNELQGCKIK